MKLVNLSNENEVAFQVNKAYRFFKRLKGLMFTKRLGSGNGLHIKPCQSVHTFFMKYAIDVIYLNESNEVIGIDEALAPGKIGSSYNGAKSVVELPAGTARRTDIQVGNKLQFIK